MREHGEYVSGRTGQHVLFAARGPWNDETMRRGVRELATHIAQLDVNQPWGQTSCLYAESLMPPSTYAVFEKQTLIRKNMGLSAIAVVIKDSDVGLTIQAQLSLVYSKLEIEHQFFDTINRALDWHTAMKLPYDREYALSFFCKHTF